MAILTRLNGLLERDPFARCSGGPVVPVGVARAAERDHSRKPVAIGRRWWVGRWDVRGSADCLRGERVEALLHRGILGRSSRLVEARILCERGAVLLSTEGLHELALRHRVHYAPFASRPTWPDKQGDVGTSGSTTEENNPCSSSGGTGRSIATRGPPSSPNRPAAGLGPWKPLRRDRRGEGNLIHPGPPRPHRC
jgi:hypothetical protein